MSMNFMNQLWIHYSLGYFKHCAKLLEMQNFDSSPEGFLSLFLRIQLGNNEIHLSQLTDYAKNDEPATKALGYYAKMILEKDNNKKNEIIQNIKEISHTLDLAARFICATALQQANEFQYALDICESNSVEMIALKMFILFKLGKFDSYLFSQPQYEDEDPLGKLFSAWDYIAVGNYKEAHHLFEDIQSCVTVSDSYQSIIILNGKATTLMQRKLWQAALKELELALSIDPQNGTTLSNLVCCHRNISNNEEAEKYFNLMTQYCEDQNFVQKSNELKSLFNNYES